MKRTPAPAAPAPATPAPLATTTLVALALLAFLAVAPSLSSAPPPAAASSSAPAAPSAVVDRVGNRAFLQVEAPSFNSLPLRQKLVAYHLAEAAIQLDPIFYDQMSDYGLEAKRLLGALVEKPDRLPADSRQAIVDFAKLFFGSKGNHNETTSLKFLPAISFDQFARAAEQARSLGAPLGTRSQLAKLLQELRRPLFDAAYQVSITEKHPPAGEDILTASSNNLYQGVRLKDLEHFTETHALDSRLVKQDGRLVEEVYRAGTPDGKVPKGRYAEELRAVNRELELAAGAADAEQARVIRALVRFYQTGDLKDWFAYNALWVRNDATVDFASGFIEVYRDARGAKGSAQMVVADVDQRLQPLMRKLAENAVYFERKAPWLEKYKKLDVKPPVGKAIEAFLEAGDYLVTTVGDNLPNEQELREKYGTKSLLLTSTGAAQSSARGAKIAVEFSPEPDEVQLFNAYGNTASNMLTAMHEIIGHGSGRVAVPNDPSTYLREYYSTLEEARADLVAYWNTWDPKLTELGVDNVREVAREMYRGLARVGLTTLAHYPTGTTAQEDHDRDRLLIVNYLIEAGAFTRVQHNGHWYIMINDFEKAHAAVGRLLAEIMRIKAEGDYAAIKALVDKYGVNFDPGVRDDVIARIGKLDLPIYFTGVWADLSLVRGSGGAVSGVRISYPRDFLSQQLDHARKNHTLGTASRANQPPLSPVRRSVPPAPSARRR